MLLSLLNSCGWQPSDTLTLCQMQFTQIHGSAERFLPEDPKVSRLLEVWSLERGLWAGGLLACVGAAGLATAFAWWHSVMFQALDFEVSLRLVLPSVTALIGSCQMILGTFFLAVLGIRQEPRRILVYPLNGARAPAQAAQPGISQTGQTALTLEREFSREQSDMWERQAWVRGSR